jgi:hypothetical protein
VATLNATYDKLYWNESIPIGGGDVTFQLRTSPTGEKNLIRNDCFELWDNYPTKEPNDWTGVSTSTTVVACASDTTTVHRGTYSVRVNTEATISQILTNSSNYAGKTLVFKGWVNSANTVADKVCIEIGDGYTVSKAYYTNTTAWQHTYTTLAVNSTATTITLKCMVHGGANSWSYFDQVMCIQGSTCSNDWSAWSSEFTNPSGDDISSVTSNTYIQYMANLKTTEIDETPNIIKSNNYCVKLTYDKGGSAQTTDIPLHWASGWMNFDAPGYIKVLRKLYVIQEGTSGTLTITVSTLDGESDTFNIDLSQYPTKYEEYFTTGALSGEWFKIDITNNDDEPLKIKKIFIMYDVEKIY